MRIDDALAEVKRHFRSLADGHRIHLIVFCDAAPQHVKIGPHPCEHPQHLLFERIHEEQYVLSDLNSTNGTYMNRVRIKVPTVVHYGDRIYIGDFVLRFEVGPRP